MKCILFYIHSLYVLAEDIEFDIDRAWYAESSDISHVPGMRYEWYSQGVISGRDYGEAYTVQCYTSLLDDEVPVLAIKTHSNKIWIILVVYDLSNSSHCIYMPCDEVSIDTGLSSDTPFHIEYISHFFRSEVRPRKTLFHSEECIILGCNISQSHADSIVSDTLSDSEWFIVEVILHNEVTTITSNNTRCAFDNSGEQERW